MFTYTLFSRVSHPTLLTGLLEGLSILRIHNSGWDYQLIDNENAHLVVLDFTDRDSLDMLTEQEFQFINQKKAEKVLVMLTATQTVLARQLIQFHRCSLLCVDERQPRLLELIEGSLKRQRYISPFFSRMRYRAEKLTSTIHFTATEKKILNRLRDGKTAKEISHEIFRSQKTISSHKRNIMQKLGVTSDLELRQAIIEISC
ncbi:helix-turn-helix transcriptional regulator [Enterobacter roggenkampii]|uniref:helix-turn-helix transcriptional regulator n=1 Tax=Enterobacter roggenkampii TaxID=1812935 RepID=UPI0012380B2B|nr:LuxR C-terminal-related transcriptional regulator [Enterobacter roggenkampii]